jgi:ADP-heptose:LPS heptosyltransferase
METPENILLIRFKSIGDIVLTLPAVNAVRDNFPRAKITFLTSEENVPLLRGFRAVNDVIPLDRAALRGGNPLKMTRKFFSLLHRLRAGKFSLVVDFQGYGETAWLSWWTGAAQRWGSVYSVGRRWAYTRSLPRNPQLHAAAEHLELLRHGGLSIGKIRNEFQLPPDALAAAREFLAEQKLEATRPILFIQPFTSVPHKNWPLENYLAVARHWQSHGVQVILGGGPADHAALEPARAEGFAVSAGVPLLVTAGLMQLAALVLGGDTGAPHLAVAQGRRVLMLMHDVKPGSPVPFQHPEWTVVPAQGTDITTIPVADIVTATERAFNESAGNVSC